MPSVREGHRTAPVADIWHPDYAAVLQNPAAESLVLMSAAVARSRHIRPDVIGFVALPGCVELDGINPDYRVVIGTL